MIASPAAPVFEWFEGMVPRCKAHALSARAEGRPVVGIMCEYAPRELILAVGGVPVCLCGGDPDTIPAAERHLPSALCPLIKSTYGYCVERANPFLEMADLVIAETTCDGKKKMFELMAERRTTYLLELPHKDDDADAFEYWVLELRKLAAFLGARYGVDPLGARLLESVRVMNRERSLRRRLADLMQADAPTLTGRQLLDLKSLVSGLPEDFARYEEALRVLGNGAPAAAPHARARVLLTGVPLAHGAERVLDLIESQGGLVVCQENCTGLKPILEDVDEAAPELLRAVAAKYFHLPCSVRTPNRRRFESLRDLAARFRAECVIDLAWQGCLTYLAESGRVKQWAETEAGLPFLRLETDYSAADSARLATRIGALVETVEHRRREAGR